MIIRSKAPLRLGLAGGGTDVSPYSDLFGGNVLNVTINMYAHCSIEIRDDQRIVFEAKDLGITETYDSISLDPITENRLKIHLGVYNRIKRDFKLKDHLSFKLTTYSDVPPGSGLGSSSTLIVAMIKAYMEWLKLPLGEYDMARLAYSIEREDLKLSGGKQDQYAATFGGFNFMEFYADNKVVINPLRVKNWIKNEIESSLVLYYTGTSRESAKIIDDQVKSAHEKGTDHIEGMHELKRIAFEMKNALLMGNFDEFAELLNAGWKSKKKTSSTISNTHIDELYDFVMKHGSKAAKISGAGGGGFMMILCDPTQKHSLMQALKTLEGQVFSPSFVEGGAQAWTIYEGDKY